MSALVIGVGNARRGDDGVGPAVAERLRALAPAELRVLSLSGEPATLLEAWSSADRVVIIDAGIGSGPAGSVHRFEAGAAPLPAALLRSSSHSLGLAEAVELGRALRRLPDELTVYCVLGRAFEPGSPLSPEVAATVDRVARTALAELFPEPQAGAL